jgi:hypothetical protein
LGAVSTNPALYPRHTFTAAHENGELNKNGCLLVCPLPKNAKAEKILIALNKLSINR